MKNAMKPRQLAKRFLIGGFLTQGLRLISPEPVLLERLKALRLKKLTTEPLAGWPQIITDETWNRLYGKLESLARTLRSRPLASSLAKLIKDKS